MAGDSLRKQLDALGADGEEDSGVRAVKDLTAFVNEQTVQMGGTPPEPIDKEERARNQARLEEEAGFLLRIHGDPDDALAKQMLVQKLERTPRPQAEDFATGEEYHAAIAERGQRLVDEVYEILPPLKEPTDSVGEADVSIHGGREGVTPRPVPPVELGERVTIRHDRFARKVPETERKSGTPVADRLTGVFYGFAGLVVGGSVLLAYSPKAREVASKLISLIPQ